MRSITRYSMMALAAVFFGLIVAAAPVHAVDVLQEGCSSGGGGTVCSATGDDLNTLSSNIVQILLYIIGIIAVIMIIIGAIKYVTANGDQSQLTSAKNTILYSIVGLILAIAAGSIIGFVLSYF